MTSIERRIDQVAKTIQARQQALISDDDDQTLTEDEFVELVVDMIRDSGLDHDGRSWVAKPGFYQEPLCAAIASTLNAVTEDQTGAVLLPLYLDEVDAALAAFDAGLLAFVRTDYLDYHWQARDVRTGSPILSYARWDQAVADLSRVVHCAAYSVHRQTGQPMPETLDAYRAWLIEVRPLGLARDLDGLQDAMIEISTRSSRMAL